MRWRTTLGPSIDYKVAGGDEYNYLIDWHKSIVRLNNT